MIQVPVNFEATGKQDPNETRVYILEAIAATGDIVTAGTTAPPTKADIRIITIGIITMRAIASAAEADHLVVIAEAETAAEAPDRLPDQDRVWLAQRESIAVGGHMTEANQSL